MQNKHQDEAPAPPFIERLAIPTSSGYTYLELNNIVSISASRNYSFIQALKDGKTLIVSRNLKQFESILKPNGFIRINRSTLINVDHILSFSRADGGFLIVTGGQQFRISKSYREQTEKRLRDHAFHL